MDELTREFLLESYENLDRLDQDFVKLETEPGDLELLKSIFRTIKGTCGFLGFGKFESLAHAGENLLSVLREGQLTLNSEIISALLAMMLGSIDTMGNEGERYDEPLIATLTQLIQPPAAAAKDEPPSPPEELAKPAEPLPVGNIGEILIKRGAAKVIDVYDAVQQQNVKKVRRVREEFAVR
jgi:two-component system, chemotaxis family, sensor kinase CheA